jgi:hypothetical protein
MQKLFNDDCNFTAQICAICFRNLSMASVCMHGVPVVPHYSLSISLSQVQQLSIIQPRVWSIMKSGTQISQWQRTLMIL